MFEYLKADKDSIIIGITIHGGEKMNYKKLYEQKIRERAYKYSEEQQLEAQKHAAGNLISHFINNVVFRAINGILHLLTIIATYVALFDKAIFKMEVTKTGTIIFAIITILLFFTIILINWIFKQKMEKQRRWIDCLSKFANDTATILFFVVIISYISDSITIYIGFALLVPIAIIFVYDIIIPCVKKKDLKWYGEFE